MPFSLEWNREGSLLAVTTKKKKLRIFDPRAEGKNVVETVFCEGTKASKIFWADNLGMIGLTCFNRTSNRFVKLYDLKNMKEAVYDEQVAQGTSILLPFYDYDTR